MPSGDAYGKSFRTAKSCVGKESCRFDTGDSTKLGVEIEGRFKGVASPAELKLAMSGCSRNCAESLVKDVCVVAIEGGRWEIYVGGAAGAHIRKGPAQKFMVGALLRIPCTFAVGTFGGRNWTIVSALLLLVPTTLIAVLLKPGVSFETLLIIAAVAGVGDGNFAPSMTNVNSYYPARLKGWALGINAGGGNLGVPVGSPS